MYKCKICEQSFGTANLLASHTNSEHTSKITCIFCGNLFSKCGIKKHQSLCKLNPDYEKEKQRIGRIISEGKRQAQDDSEQLCKFCGKICKNHNSLINHERMCSSNPNRDIHYVTDRESRTPWNKGLSKKEDIRLALRGENLRKRYEQGELQPTFKGKHHSKDTIMHLSAVATDKDFQKHFGRHRCHSYNGILFDSSYEVALAKALDAEKVSWVKPKRLPYYDHNGKQHFYTADFYLPQYDVYLDPKNDYLIQNTNPVLGYRDVDKIKWVMEQNNVKVFILDKEHLTWNTIRPLIDKYLESKTLR